jgi:hypothetical protein
VISLPRLAPMFRNLAAALKAQGPQIHRLDLRRADLEVGGAGQAIVELELAARIVGRPRQP